jgi:hypothetical protein
MAILSKTGITNGTTIEASHITQIIEALTAEQLYDISISGSLTITGSIVASEDLSLNGNLISRTANLDEFLILQGLNSDPSPLQEGQVWHRGDLNQLRVYLNGVINVINVSPII